MNDIVKQMANGYLSTFDSYQITDESLKQEVEQLKKEFNELINKIDNPINFQEELTSSGLQEKYMSLISKVVTSTITPQETKQNIPSVKEYINQYQTAYQEVKKNKYKINTIKTYEILLNIDKKTDNIIEAQIIIEKERLLWKIVSIDFQETYEALLKSIDPLNEFQRKLFEYYLETYTKDSDEELSYEIERSEIIKLTLSKQEETRLTLLGTLSKELISYIKAKIGIYEWSSESKVKGYVKSLLESKQTIIKILNILEKQFNLSINDIFNKENNKLTILVPKSKDELGRIKTISNIDNIEYYLDIINNEILSNISLIDILKRKSKFKYYFNLSDNDQLEYDNQVKKQVEDLNKDIPYFKYLNSFKSIEIINQIKEYNN